MTVTMTANTSLVQPKITGQFFKQLIMSNGHCLILLGDKTPKCHADCTESSNFNLPRRGNTSKR